MAIRPASIKEVAFYVAGGAIIDAAVPGYKLGEGTGATKANPTEGMVPGFAREVLRQYDFTVNLKSTTATNVSVYKSAWIANTTDGAAGDPPGGVGNEWDELGRLDQDGSIEFTPRVRTDGALLPLYRGCDLELTFGVLDLDNHDLAVAFNDTLCYIALERIDGTFRIFKNVYVSFASIDPGGGAADRNQLSMVRAVASVFDVNDLLKTAITEEPFASLNTKQKAGDWIDVLFSHQDGTNTTKLLTCGFSIVPVESFAQASLVGYACVGSAVSASEAGVITLSPVLT